MIVSAPGRICLFGEHQDYLGLPVITMAINLRIAILTTSRSDRIFHIDMPDIQTCDEIDLTQSIVYRNNRDYLRSGVNVLLRRGVRFQHGYDFIIRGSIPINSGTSSSSALVVAWIKLLLILARERDARNPSVIARLAHQAEVMEFNEPGGMMDHYAASYGSALYLEFAEPIKVEMLPAQLGTFVLGDSMQPKDTKEILSRIKGGVLGAFAVLLRQDPSLTMRNITEDHLRRHASLLSKSQQELLTANIRNRDLTQQALQELHQPQVNHEKFGQLLNAHQVELRDRLRISTARIDRMIDAALQSGALGAKINGSGGGGCMFAYAPERTQQVEQAINKAAGKAFIITCDKGVEQAG